MRSRFYIVLGIAGSLLLGACSSSTDEGGKLQTNSSPAANSAAASEVAQSGNSNTSIVANGMVVAPPQTADANAAASADPMVPGVAPQVNEKLQNMKSGSGRPVDAASLALRNARPAPDNSTFASYLTDAGYEIRTFRNHPQLLKVEKRIGSDGNQSLKIYLRDGKVVQLPGKAIDTLSTAPAATIAGLAGINPAPVKAPAPGSTGAKNPVN